MLALFSFCLLQAYVDAASVVSLHVSSASVFDNKSVQLQDGALAFFHFLLFAGRRALCLSHAFARVHFLYSAAVSQNKSVQIRGGVFAFFQFGLFESLRALCLSNQPLARP